MRHLLLTLCRVLVSLASGLVPQPRRERWRREWLAEMAYDAQRADRESGSGRLLRRALLSCRDALDVRFRAGAPSAEDRRGLAVRFDDLLQDLSFGFRSLRRAPGLTLLAAATIAFGIGLTTAIFSLVNGILLQPLPYSEPDRLVVIWPEQWYSAEMIEQVEQRLDAYEAIAGYQSREHTLLSSDGAERIWGPTVTAGFFDVLGRELILGRSFAPGEDRPGARVAVVTHRFWLDRLGGDPDAVGSTIRLGDGPYTVIGVLRPDFDLIQHDAELVIPYTIDPAAPDYTSQDLKLFGRLATGRTAASALPELQAYVDTIREDADAPEDWGRDASIRPLAEYLVGTTRPTLLLLFGAVGLTLLIATANVAGLLLTRALGRRRELAVRTALGARRGRLIRQLVTEATVLSALGLLPGLLLARLGQQTLLQLLPADTPRLQHVAIDGWALAFSFALTLATGWFVGTVSALQVARVDAGTTLGEASRGSSESRGRRRLRSGIVLVEIALAVTLAVGAGVLLKSFSRLQAVDPGFRADGLVTFRVDPVAGTFASAEEAEPWYESLRSELLRLPGVLEVSEAWKVPYAEDGGINGIRRTDVPADPDALAPLVRWRPVPPDYFHVAGLRLLAGRTFAATDADGTPPVAVISQRTAREVFGGDDPLGKPFITSVERDIPATVIGVVDDVKLGGVDQEATAVVYRPYAQLRELITRHGFYGRWLVLRVAEPIPAELAADARRIVRAHDASALVADFTTLRGAIDRSISGRRATTTLMSSFALAALLLGAIGTYGVMAYSVRQRWREIGIRVALGATRRRIVRGILREALTLAGLGTALGLALAALLSGLVRSFVFEVDPLDPWVLGIAVGVTALVAAGAAFGPACRAGRVDPAQTLTSDA